MNSPNVNWRLCTIFVLHRNCTAMINRRPLLTLIYATLSALLIGLFLIVSSIQT